MYKVPQKNGRLRPKPSAKNKPKITADEKLYLEWLQEQSEPCFHCGSYKSIEWHHIKEYSTDKKDHAALIPLCTQHHTGTRMSPHGTPKQFRERYPMEVQRWQAAIYYNKYIKQKGN